ncbi:MAG TPA: CopD family protein, partial [Polyangiaceae bacterium]|nr:CopD family protein [Polyangiaceae bacterium]
SDSLSIDDAAILANVSATVWSIEALLLCIHVIANLFWIGSITAVGLLVAAGASAGSAADLAVERGRLARLVYQRLATPAFGISFLAGVARLVLNLQYYFVASHFMHGKLTFALGVIALHHVIGARAKKLAAGQLDASRGAGTLTWACALLAVGAAFFVLIKPF